MSIMLYECPMKLSSIIHYKCLNMELESFK